MVVAVQRELAGIMGELRQKGYEAVVFGEYKAPIDALVYEGRTFSVSNLLDKPSIEARADAGDEQVVLLIDASGRSIEEIVNVLKRKLYSPIFP